MSIQRKFLDLFILFSKMIEKILKEERKCQDVHSQVIRKKLKASQILIHNRNINERNQEVSWDYLSNISENEYTEIMNI